jgi:hypothetical protein
MEQAEAMCKQKHAPSTRQEHAEGCGKQKPGTSRSMWQAETRS